MSMSFPAPTRAKRSAYRNVATAPKQPSGPPRVWTVWVNFFVALAAMLLANGVVFVAFIVAIWSPEVSARFGANPAALIRPLAEQPAVILGSALASVLTFSAFALVPAALSPSSEMIRERLRLWQTSRWYVHGVLTTVALLGLGNLADGVRTLAGATDHGSLRVIERAFANMEPALLALAVVIAGLGAGIAEELFFRGYMQTRLEQRWHPVVASIATSLCFALVHFDPWHSAFALLVGLHLAWVARRTGSILPTITAHVLNNTVSTLAMSLAPDADKGHGLRSVILGVVLFAVGAAGFWVFSRKTAD